MAELITEGSELLVRMSSLERLAAFRGDVRVPLGAIQSIEVEPKPWSALRGIRAPGTGFPGVIAYGVRHFSGGKDFVAIHGQAPAVRIELGDGAPFARLLITMPDPEEIVRGLRSATQWAENPGPAPAEAY